MPSRVCPVFTRTVPAEPVEAVFTPPPRAEVLGRDGVADCGSAEAPEDDCARTADPVAGGAEFTGDWGESATVAGDSEPADAGAVGAPAEACEGAGRPIH